MDDEGELADPKPSKWTTPPDSVSKSYDDPSPVITAAPPSGDKPATSPSGLPPAPPSPLLPPAERPMRPATYDDLIAKAGHEVTKVGGAWKAGGALILIGSLILAAENGLILYATFQLGYPFLQGGGGSGGPPSGAAIVDFLARLDLATRIDQIGFAILGAGLLTAGIGSRAIEVKTRSSGETKRIAASAAGLLGAAGACCFVWVVLSMMVRTGLTGSPSGNWSGTIATVFAGFGDNSGGALPPEYDEFVQAFTAVSRMWILATVFLAAGAIAMWRGGRVVRDATGIKIGGVAFVTFGISAVFSIALFVGGIEKLFAAVIGVYASGGEFGEVLEQVIVPIALGMASKLVWLPIAGVFAFLMLAGVGARIMKVKAGRAYITRKEDKDVRKRIKAGTAMVPREPGTAGPSAGVTEPNVRPQSGDVVVSVADNRDLP